MDQSRTITIDNYQITPQLIERAFKKARQQNKTKEVLAETFRLMNLNKLYQSNPSDSSIKQAIKVIVDSQFLSNATQLIQRRAAFDLSQVFLLNKLGNFGRSLQRKCRLVKNGVMEFQDDKLQPKFKQIKKFVNKIQTIGDSQNDTKIGWHSEQKKYPFRIILIDKSDGHRGIYFDTKQKAQKIRIMLTQTYLYQGDFGNLVSKLAANLQLQVHQKFKVKLVSRAKMLNASTRFSRKITFQANKMAQQAPAIRIEQNTSIFSKANKKIEVDQRQRRDEMLIISEMINSKANEQLDLPPVEQSFQKINRLYLNNLFKVWQQAQVRALQLQDEKQASAQIEKEDNSLLVHSKINGSQKKQKIQRFNDLFSKKKLDISNLSMSKGKKQLEVADMAQSSLKDRNKSIKNKPFKGQNSASKGENSLLRGEQSFIKQLDGQFNPLYDQICFYKIGFLTLKNLFFKPIVTIELLRKNTVQKSALFNTIIIKKQPELVYELLRDKQDDPLVVNSNLKQFQISVRVIDFLSNEEIVSDKISLKNKILSTKTWVQGDNKLVQLQLGLQKAVKQQQSKIKQLEDDFNKVQLQIPPLTEATREKISQFWEKELQSQGYYNETDLSIYNILSHAECIPLTWWKDVSQEEYELLQIIYVASKIIGFKMLRSFSHIIKVFAKIYSDLQVLTEKLLSFVQTFLRVYYFPQSLNKIQKFHKLIGLDQDCQFISKINLEILVINKITELQCPILVDKLKRKNIAYGYVIMQYIYQAFSRNFTLSNLKDLWNFLYKDLQYLQLNMALISVFLIKSHQQDLLKAKRLKEFTRILQSKKVSKISTLINQLDSYKQKYFGKAKGFIDQIKNIFNARPLEPIIQQFYKRETSKIDKRKKAKLLQKKSSLRKVNRQIDLQFPEYQQKKYTLHIVFTQIPEAGGSLTLKCADIEYQCLNHQKKRYFIISQVSSAVYLHFLDLKANQFSCELIFNQGIHENSCFLTSQKLVKGYKFSYIAGLLTDNQIQILKRGKKFEHFVSPFVKQTEMLQQMHRPLGQTYFLRKYDSYNSKQDLVKKIKSLFCSGNKLFNEIEFYIEHIETSDLTIQEKFYSTKMLAKQFSQQFCLCNNHIFQKHFLRHFLESAGYELTSHQFECFYSDSFQYEFDAPKILKCRFYPINQLNKEIKLQLAALEYFVAKSVTYMYSDIFVDDLIQALTPSINEQLGGLLEGDLKLYYSSASQIFMKSWHLKPKNKNKQFSYEEIMEDVGKQVQEEEMEEPELLMSQILPSFAKISTILDYVNSNRTVDLKSKYQDKDRKKIAEQINILKESQIKLRKILMMRHLKPPEKLYFPFFDYYYELTRDFSTPNVKTIFFNNLKSDLKTICLFKGHLKFGQNAKVESHGYNTDIGLYGNLRMISKDAKGWFFFGLVKDEHENQNTNARIFVNYGYGIFRWESCIVLGYVMRKKEVKTQKAVSEVKFKKQYLVRVRSQEKYVKDYELDISPQVSQKIQKINDQFQKSQRYERKNIEDNQQQRKSSQLKYLSKFMK